jgi:3-dehydroquinate synthase
MAYVGRFDGSEAKHASPAMAAAAGGDKASAEDPSALPTSTKWSVLSSRVEGLVAELSQVIGKQDAYCVSQSRAETAAMAAVREKMLTTNWAEEWANKKTMFSYGEEMSTDPLEAMLLKQLSFMAAPRRVLEIGMFVGYGSVAILEGAPDAQLVSLDIDPYLKTWLAECLTPFPAIAKRHEVVVGPALEGLPGLQGEFDLVFVDANKAEYKRYVEIILEKNLLSSGGMIVADNVLYNGYPYVHSHFDAQPARRQFGDAIREFNEWVCNHPLLEQVVLPIRDGVSLIRRRAGVPDRSLKLPTVAEEAGTQNLVQQKGTWTMMPPAEAAAAKAADPSAIVSDALISEKPLPSGGKKEWTVSSPITFDYRVVEEDNVLDPKSKTLLYGHLSEAEKAIAERKQHQFKYVVVVDSQVFDIYGDRITAYFEENGAKYKLMVLETIEENKDMKMVLEIAETVNNFGIDRRLDPVISIGGGVCMDIVGFAASIYRRRTPYVRVPTTLIGYVDASVGAKTGCNFCNKKNKLGAYIPPKLAVLDRSFLQTLDERQLTNGSGEIMKMALMKDRRLFELLEAHGPQLITGKYQAPEGSNASADASTEVLQRAIATMLEELAPNLWEDSLDRLVDFGHVFSMELEMGVLFDEKLFHGEAVNIDMAFCCVLSFIRGQISREECARMFKVMRGLKLPVSDKRFDAKLCSKALKDREEFSQGQKMPLPVGIGEARIFNDITTEQVDEALKAWPSFAEAA